MMDYELCEKLRAAGFPQAGGFQYYTKENAQGDKNGSPLYQRSFFYGIADTKIPTLNELIEACGGDPSELEREYANKYLCGK